MNLWSARSERLGGVATDCHHLVRNNGRAADGRVQLRRHVTAPQRAERLDGHSDSQHPCWARRLLLPPGEQW